MNILFFTTYEVDPNKGGTERITWSVANYLKSTYNFKVFSIFEIKGNTPQNSPFEHFFCCKKNQKFVEFAAKIIYENQIDLIINQGDFFITSFLKKAIEQSSHNCKLFFCHHFSPSSEENICNFANIFKQLKKNLSLKNFIFFFGYPLIKIRYNYLLHKKYAQTYSLANKVILLSKKFIPEFTKYGHFNDTSKFESIPNMLSFNDFFEMSDYDKKQKEVVIVSRLTETQKKISLALKIWQILQDKYNVYDWKLTIVGTGSQEKVYKNFVKKHNLNVSFEGKQNPQEYYKRASIFMMTSSYEGWGLTLTECSQYGCVPLAFNSYASLTDIITDSKNGFIIPYADLNTYSKKIYLLMQNNELRKKMAANAIENSKRFSAQNIGKMWMKLIQI